MKWKNNRLSQNVNLFLSYEIFLCFLIQHFFSTFTFILDSILQSVSNMQDSESTGPALMKALVFYMAVTAEAFIFCFCGEYLSAKVGTHNWFL